MFRNRSANTDHFAMIPKANIQRSSMRAEQAHKTTFDAGYLVPFLSSEGTTSNP